MGLVYSMIRDLGFLAGIGLVWWGLADIDPRWAKVVVGSFLVVMSFYGLARSLRNDSRSPR